MCQRGKYKGLQGITCPYGCNNGICIVPPGNTCIDTDNGVKYGIQGQTKVCWDNYCLLGGLETCIDTANLTESYCTPEKTIKWITYECPHGCVNGACVEAPLPVCEGLQMVWEQGRRENYTYSADPCTGYRCLRGNEISPECYNAATCPSACTNGMCVFIPEMKNKCPPPQPITLPQPVITPQPITETVTCLFVFPTKLPVCTSSKGSCTGALGSSSTCTVQVSGVEGEVVTWTSDCGNDAKPVTTAINGQNKSIAFICTQIRMPREPKIPLWH
ncbi:MAG: hypothetical protein QXR48_01030 [Candidatus Woesearchaeota archaeon]